MIDRRFYHRLDCEAPCQLYLRDSMCPAVVRNISLGDALVHFPGPLPDMCVGDTCKLVLNGNLACEYNCEVVRIETSCMALRFIDLGMPDSLKPEDP